uniref:Uncharacterized protein n=1 Tax=Anopheles coluzzii TaxID=1518534 RepID=A0A8W7P113_ANOCL
MWPASAIGFQRIAPRAKRAPKNHEPNQKKTSQNIASARAPVPATAANIIVTATAAAPGSRYHHHPPPSGGTSAPGGGSRKLSFNIGKMEHADLVAEMAQVEHLSTQDRLHLARIGVFRVRLAVSALDRCIRLQCSTIRVRVR